MEYHCNRGEFDSYMSCQFLIDCSGEEDGEKTPDTAYLNKKSALIQLAEESPVTKTSVFYNKIETCWKLENALNEFTEKALLYKFYLSMLLFQKGHYRQI